MKKLLKILVLLVILIVAAVLALGFYIDDVARAGIEKGGSHALGVDTTLGQADVGLLSGTFSLDSLAVANPPGFQAEKILRLGHGEVAVSLATLREDVVTLPRFALSDLQLQIEHDGKNANYQAIMDNLGKLESEEGTDPEEPAPTSEEGKRFRVEEILIQNIKVTAQVVILGGDPKQVELVVPEVRLTDVGSDSDRGLLLWEVAGIVFKAVMTAVTEAGKGVLPDLLLGDLTKNLASLESLKAQGVNLLDGAGKELGKAISDSVPADLKGAVEKATDDLGGNLKGLLGGDKEKREGE